MYRIIYSKRFEKDIKLCKKREYNLTVLAELIKHLQKNGNVPSINKPHKLLGKYTDCWECHIKPDWLIIWMINRQENKIELIRTGTHSDLF